MKMDHVSLFKNTYIMLLAANCTILSIICCFYDAIDQEAVGFGIVFSVSML